MVGRPSGYGGFPYQRNTFCSMAVVTNAALPNVGSRGPLGHPPLPGVVRPAPAPEGVREVRSLAQLRCSPTSRPPPPQAWSSGRGPRITITQVTLAVRQNRVVLAHAGGRSVPRRSTRSTEP